MKYLKLSLLAAVAAAFVIQPVQGQTPHTSSGYRLWRGDPVLQANGATVDQMIANFVRKHNLPGITMAIVEAPYNRAAGRASRCARLCHDAPRVRHSKRLHSAHRRPLR